MAAPLGLSLVMEAMSQVAAHARQEPPHLVVLDVSDSPEGMEVLGRLKNHPKTSQLPVVILGAAEDHEDRDVALDLGAAGYIIKPITADFLAKLSTFLSG